MDTVMDLWWSVNTGRLVCNVLLCGIFVVFQGYEGNGAGPQGRISVVVAVCGLVEALKRVLSTIVGVGSSEGLEST